AWQVCNVRMNRVNISNAFVESQVAFSDDFGPALTPGHASARSGVTGNRIATPPARHRRPQISARRLRQPTRFEAGRPRGPWVGHRGPCEAARSTGKPQSPVELRPDLLRILADSERLRIGRGELQHGR